MHTLTPYSYFQHTVLWCNFKRLLNTSNALFCYVLLTLRLCDLFKALLRRGSKQGRLWAYWLYQLTQIKALRTVVMVFVCLNEPRADSERGHIWESLWEQTSGKQRRFLKSSLHIVSHWEGFMQDTKCLSFKLTNLKWLSVFFHWMNLVLCLHSFWNCMFSLV